jgi:DNA modification methylase
LITKEHEWKKPEPLIERLLLNHYPKHGIVYDPCAGSRTVEKVCKKLGIPSHSVDDGKKPNLDVELKKKDMEENLFSEKS